MADNFSYKQLMGMLKTKPGELTLSENFRVRVGERLTPEKIKTLKKLEADDSQVQQIRVINAEATISQDYQALRLNIALDKGNKVKTFYYG